MRLKFNIAEYYFEGEQQTLLNLQNAIYAAQEQCKNNSELCFMRVMLDHLGLLEGAKGLLLRQDNLDWKTKYEVIDPVHEFGDTDYYGWSMGIKEYSNCDEHFTHIASHMSGVCKEINWRKCDFKGYCSTNNEQLFTQKYFVYSKCIPSLPEYGQFIEDEQAMLQLFDDAFTLPEQVNSIESLLRYVKEQDVECTISEVEHEESYMLDGGYNYGLYVEKMLEDAPKDNPDSAIDQLYTTIHNTITCCVLFHQCMARFGGRLRYNGRVILFERPIDVAQLQQLVKDFGCPEWKEEYLLGYDNLLKTPVQAASDNIQSLVFAGVLERDCDALRQAAQEGDAAAQYACYMSLIREGDKKEEALTWLQKAVDAGLPAAQYTMAGIYNKLSRVTDEENQYTYQLLLAAAQAGHPDAVRTLALEKFSCANLLPESEREQWLIRAAALQDFRAAERLADWYFSHKDYSSALLYYQQAENNYQIEYQSLYHNTRFASMYYYGWGVEVDYVRAAYLWSWDLPYYLEGLKATNQSIDTEALRTILAPYFEEEQDNL